MLIIAVLLDFPWELINCLIACNGKLLHQVQHFCVEQDFSFKMLDNSIACKGTWLLHVFVLNNMSVISALFKLFRSWFWPNFHGCFLETSLTVNKCQIDICTDKIYSGDICPCNNCIISINTDITDQIGTKLQVKFLSKLSGWYLSWLHLSWLHLSYVKNS